MFVGVDVSRTSTWPRFKFQPPVARSKASRARKAAMTIPTPPMTESFVENMWVTQPNSPLMPRNML